MRLTGPTNIQQALARALEVESAKLASRATRKQVRAVQVEDDPNNSAVNLLLKKVEELLSVRADSYNRRGKLECWNCGLKGHLRAQCRNRAVKRFAKEDEGKNVTPQENED